MEIFSGHMNLADGKFKTLEHIESIYKQLEGPKMAYFDMSEVITSFQCLTMEELRMIKNMADRLCLTDIGSPTSRLASNLN